MTATIVKECFHILLQIFNDGLRFSSFGVFVFWPVFIIDGGEIFYRNKTTPSTLDRILGHIKIAYPSVSQVDHVLVVTWYNITNTQFHNGRVSNMRSEQCQKCNFPFVCITCYFMSKPNMDE